VHPDAELAPRDVVSRAILQRMVATGDTHVYLDLSGVHGDPHALFPSISRICASFDIDIARDPVPVRPGAHYMIGGIDSTLEGRTSVDGLWVAGEVASTGLHGANRLASNSLLEGAVMGRAAGAEAAARALAEPGPPLPTWPDPLASGSPRVEPRIQLDDMLYSLKSMMWRLVGLDRDATGLTEARDRIGFWHHYLFRAALRGRQACELLNMLTTSALIAVAALTRAESRGTHFRRDHPNRDDERWCRSIVLRRSDSGEVATELGPLVAPSDRDA
jgi:L-aspartate oxidase